MIPEIVSWWDPGGMSGQAVLYNHGALFYADEYPFEKVGDQAEDVCQTWGPGLTIGIERYHAIPGKPQTNAGDAYRPMGVIEHYALRYGCHLVWANPADRLTIPTKALQKMGFWVPGKDDAQEAARHLVAWCEREHVLPPRERAILSEVRASL